MLELQDLPESGWGPSTHRKSLLGGGPPLVRPHKVPYSSSLEALKGPSGSRVGRTNQNPGQVTTPSDPCGVTPHSAWAPRSVKGRSPGQGGISQPPAGLVTGSGKAWRSLSPGSQEGQ